jgi:hypothetical protein
MRLLPGSPAQNKSCLTCRAAVAEGWGRGMPTEWCLMLAWLAACQAACFSWAYVVDLKDRKALVAQQVVELTAWRSSAGCPCMQPWLACGSGACVAGVSWVGVWSALGRGSPQRPS